MRANTVHAENMGRDGQRGKDTADEKDWVFDGTKVRVAIQRAKGLLHDIGGANLVGHFTGKWTQEKVAKTIVRLAPIEVVLDENDPDEEDAEFGSMEAIPPLWKHFCMEYVPGKTDLADPLTNKKLKLAHFQRPFIKGLARSQGIHNTSETLC